MVLEYEAARGEAMRLSGFHAGIENPNLGLKIEEIEDLSAIDGSIIMDTRGQIHGSGFILDGDSETEMDPARGSTVEFCQKVSELSAKKSVPGMILVVSEDGSIEVLPAYV